MTEPATEPPTPKGAYPIRGTTYFVGSTTNTEDLHEHLRRLADIVQELDDGADALHLPICVTHIHTELDEHSGWGTLVVLE